METIRVNEETPDGNYVIEIYNGSKWEYVTTEFSISVATTIMVNLNNATGLNSRVKSRRSNNMILSVDFAGQPTEPATKKEPDGWVQDDNFITHAEYEELTALHEEPWKPVYFSPVSQTKGLDITDEEIGKRIDSILGGIKAIAYFDSEIRDSKATVSQATLKTAKELLIDLFLSQSKQETETNK